ncbi:site-specific integrase [Azospirillum sp. SYSU D00513]|uniref:tyrosine-type recombinase/integrase n=1 Tax=Azospirillum sp. SYSU D00513 TaxID=2812561 RepID=UPI001A972676|nr:site-specific integrase [Azospirillum sp. SYSU D00513]
MGKRLTAVQVRTLKEPGRYGDGDGLALVIAGDGSRKWVLRIQHEGKRRDFGLGSASGVSLAEAREAADTFRKQVRNGIDPTKQVAEEAAPEPQTPTFRDAALQVLKTHKPSWKNSKHGNQWLATMEAYAFPLLGDRRVDEITSGMICDTLVPIWLKIPETARRVRQRIGTVLDWAHARGYRPAEAPMRSVSKGLPRQPKTKEHFPAMPWQEVPAFITALRETPKAGEVVKLAFEFLILTAVRSGEMRGAVWSEIDIEGRLWSIPKERMKATKAHVVPLSDRAVEILKQAQELRTSEAPATLVFPGAKLIKPMSDMTLTMLLRRMETGCTAHGFRSSFRDWAAESTNFPREVVEAALAHAVESRVEAAYLRSDLLEKRRRLMDAWAGFCVPKGGKVVPMARRKA